MSSTRVCALTAALFLLMVTTARGQESAEENTINLPTGSLRAALDTLMNRYGISVAYLDTDIENRFIPVSCRECSAEQALTALLKTTPLQWQKVGSQYILSAHRVGSSDSHGTITGVIRDGATQEPLALAHVAIKGTSMGTSTDQNGVYTLQLPRGKVELLVSSIGYKAEEVIFDPGDGQTIRNISLTNTEILLQEVTVFASSGHDAGTREVSSLSLQSKRISENSSVIPDVLRSIQSLPGISANNEFSAKFNVRGGNSDENLVLVNGTQVYEPFHVKEVSNASIGIFNVNLMRKVDLVTGGFSARYGDRMSSVLNIEYREGDREHYGGAATLSLTNLDGYVEGPLGAEGSFIIGARKSYVEYLLSLLGAQRNPRPSFYDVQGVLAYPLTATNKLLVQFIHAGDNFTQDPTNESRGPYVSQGTYNGQQATSREISTTFDSSRAEYFSTMFDVQNTSIISDRASLKIGLSYYDERDQEYHIQTNAYTHDVTTYQNLFYRSRSEGLLDNTLRISTLEANGSADIQIDPFYELVAGLRYQNITYRLDLTARRTRTEEQNFDSYPDTTQVQQVEDFTDAAFERLQTRSFKLAGYMEHILQASDALLFNVGGRVDYFDFNRQWTFSPRLSGSYRLFPITTIRAAWGQYYQSPMYRQLSSDTPSDTNTHAQRATHYVLGIENIIPFDESSRNSLTIKVEGYYKEYQNLISSTQTTLGRIDYSHKNDAAGSAKGVDAFVMLNVAGFYAWASYGYLVATERLLGDGNPAYPRSTDQRHTLSVVSDVDLGDRWDLNVRFTYGSGFPYTPFVAKYNPAFKRYEWFTGSKNSAYLPKYERVDLCLSKEFAIGSVQVRTFLDVSNAFDFTNVQGYRYRFDSSGYPVIDQVSLWPVIPTLGLTVRF